MRIRIHLFFLVISFLFYCQITSWAQQAPSIALTTDQSSYAYPQTVILGVNMTVYSGTATVVGYYSNGIAIGTTSTAPYTFLWNPAPGTYSLTAKVIDSSNLSSISDPVTITVGAHLPPAVTLTTDQSSYIYPQTVTLKPAITIYGGTVQIVGFYNNGVGIGTSLTAPYTYAWTPPPGTYSVTAKVVDSTNASSISDPVTVAVGTHVPPTISLTTDKSSYNVPGNNIVMKANVWAAGAVQVVGFYNGGSLLNTTSTSPYTYTWSNVAAGTYNLTAKVVDSLNVSTVTDPLTVTVNPYAPPTVSLTTDKSTYVYPQKIVLTASPWASNTVSSVAFYNGSTLLSTVTASPYTCTWTPPKSGSYSFSAVVVDDQKKSTTSSAVTVSVTAHVPPVISMTADNASYTLPNVPILTAYPSVSTGTIASVSFYNGSALLSTVTSSPFTYTWSSATAGTYNLTAKTIDSTGASATSSAVSVTINPHVPPVVSLTTDNATYTYPQNVILTANASVGAGTISSVAFYNGSNLLGTVTSSPFTYTWSPAKAGSYSLTAKVTDSTGASTVSSAVAITVNAHVPPVVTLTADKTSYIYPSSVTLTATASISAGTISSVSFYNGNTLLKTVTKSPYTYTWTNPAVGIYTLTAKATDNTGASTSSTAVTITVSSHAPPTVSLTTDKTGYIYPMSVVLTASATASAGTITSVSFYNGSSLLGTVSKSPFTYTWVNPAVGSYNVTAKATDSSGVSGTSSAAAVTVSSHAPPIVSLTTDNTSYIYPQSAVLTATASVNAGMISSVSFYNGTALLTTIASNPFTYTWTPPKAGIYSLTAKATDSTGASTTSSAVSITVTAHVPPTISLVTDNTTYIYPQSVLLTPNASVSAGAISSVTFYNGTAALATVTKSPFTYSWTPPKAGTYSLTAKATDSTGVSTMSSAVSVTVTAHVPPLVSLSADSTAYTLPNVPTLTAAASVSGGTIANVSFYNGSTLLGTVTSSPYIYKWSSAGAGTYNLTAKVTDSTGVSTTSSAVTITVNSHVPPVVSVSADKSGYIYPQNIVLTANASVSAGMITAVSFYYGNYLLGTTTKSPFTYTWSSVPAGSYSLTAKATDSTGASTTSAALSVIVAAHVPPVISLSTDKTTYVLPAAPVLTATASVSAGTITGVSFYNGSTLLATLSKAPYTYTWSAAKNGSYTLTAKATDNTRATTTSAPVSITINLPPPPLVSMAIPVNNSTYTAPANIIIYPNLVPNAPVAKVDYYNGTKLIGTSTGSPFSYSWNAVGAGSYNLTAKATDMYGSVGTSSAASVTVNRTAPAHTPPAVNITVPANNTSYSAPAAIPLTAAAAATNATISSVSFFTAGINGPTLIGSVTGSPFSYNWNNVAAGNYSIIAVATDSTGAATTSAAVNVSVSSAGVTALVPVIKNFIGVTSAASIYDNPGGNVIGSESLGAVGTVVDGPQTSTDQYFKVHFPDTNTAGWIDQNNMTVLATTSSEMAAYALIKYAAPSFNLTPAVGGLTNAQATQLGAALKALSGRKFMVFNGQVVLMQGNTNIQVNTINNVVNMQITTVGTGAQNFGTALLADLSQIDALSTCDTGDPWHGYVYCLLDNAAKTSVTSGAALNLNTDPVMTAVNSYLNSTYAAIGGIAKNFVITIDPSGQGLEIDPASGNSLSASDASVSLSFYNDPLNYDPTAVAAGIAQIQSQATDTNTTNFYIASDNLIDERTMNDIDQMIESVGGGLLPASNVFLKSAVQQKAALHMAAVQKIAVQRSAFHAVSIKKNTFMRSMAVSQTADLPNEETCYDQQTGSVIPCNTIIDFVQGQRDWFLNLPLGGISTMATLMYQDVAELQNLGYTVNRITYADPQFAADPTGISFLQSLIQTQGQVLFLQFHGSGSSIEDADVGPGKIFPFGCINPYLPQYKGLTEPVLAAETDLVNQLKAQLYPQYLNQDPTVPGVVSFKAGYGCFAYVNGLKKPILGWGLDLNSTNIRSKALETGYPCHGSLGALRPLAGVRNYGALATYLNPPPSKSQSQARFDLKLLVKYLEGMGPLTPASITPIIFDQGSPYNTYPPQLNNKFNSYIQNTLDNGGPTELTNVGTKNLFDCTNTVQGPSGPVTVNIPCKMEPFGASVHLFPYITGLSQSSNGMTLAFSDQVTTPSIDFTVNGHNPFSYAYTSNNQYLITSIPEVEILDQGTYNTYINNSTGVKVPMSVLSVYGAVSSVNGIPMVGNPLASLTQKNADNIPYFLYDPYFWNYSGRNQPGGQDVNTFKANIPYRLHPYVDSVTSSGNQMWIVFSKPVLGAGDAGGYVSVDVSQCTKDGAFAGGQSPVFSSNNGNSITMTFNPNLAVPAQSPTGNATITVSNIVSSPNNFPLLSDGSTFGYNGAVSDTGNAAKFLKTPGSFTMNIPCSCAATCSGKKTGDDDGCSGTCTCSCNGKSNGADDGCGNACSCSCAGKANGDNDGCGGICCVPSAAPNWYYTNPGNYSESNCGGTYLDTYQLVNGAGVENYSYTAASGCTPLCPYGGSTGNGTLGAWSCANPIIDCKK